MKSFQRFDIVSDQAYVIYFKGLNITELSNKIHDLFVMSEYRLEIGEKANGKYLRGFFWKRILLGIFHKHFEFSLTLTTEGDEMRLNLIRISSGWSGGFLGVGQVKDEMKTLLLKLNSI